MNSLWSHYEVNLNLPSILEIHYEFTYCSTKSQFIFSGEFDSNQLSLSWIYSELTICFTNSYNIKNLSRDFILFEIWSYSRFTWMIFFADQLWIHYLSREYSFFCSNSLWNHFLLNNVNPLSFSLIWLESTIFYLNSL